MCAVWTTTLAVGAPELVRATKLDPDSDRIMEVSLPDGTVLSSATIIYPYRGSWVLPLGQFAETLGLGITVWSKNRLAEGFVIDESRRFRLDAARCQVTYDGKTEPYRCEEVIEKDDEFYVQDTLLARWFPVDIDVSTLGSVVIVHPRELLPAEARRKREQEAQNARSSEEPDPGYERQAIPYSALGFYALDQQLQISSDRNTGIGRMFNGNSLLSGEAAGMETSFLANYTEKELAGWRFTAMRRSPDGDIAGSAKLTQISLFDVDLPTIPLVTEVQPLRGFFVSSYPLNDPLNWENTDLQGVLPAGWEVLLFRNEVFFDRRVGDASGWYRFNNVPLQYGRNVLKLVFFGPHGERREQYRTLNIDREHQKAKRRDYRLGMGFKPTNGHPAMAFQISESLAKSLTALGGFYYEQDTGKRYATAGLVGLTDFALGTARVASSLDGGHALELGVQTGVERLALGAKYTMLHDFRSQLFNLTTTPMQTAQWEANAFYLIPAPIGLVWTSEFLGRNFEGGTSETLWRNRLTTNVKSVQIQTQVDWTPTAPNKLFGRTELFYFPYALRFRGVFEYDFQRLTAVELETQMVQPDRYQLTANLRWPLDGNPLRVLVQGSKLFRELSLGTFVNAVVDGPLTLGLFAAFSVLREPRTGTWTAVRNPQGYNGAVSLFAFEDRNHNGVADPGEPGIPGREFQMCSRDPARTESSGIVHVSGIRAQFPCDVKALETPEADPFLRPVRPGLRITPRSGISAKIDFPFHRVGQIDGHVRTGQGKAARGKRNVEIELLAADGKVLATARSDSDGFYAFEEILAGFDYQLRIKPEWSERTGLVAQPTSRRTSVAPEGAFVSGQDFEVKSERAPQSIVKPAAKPRKRPVPSLPR